MRHGRDFFRPDTEDKPQKEYAMKPIRDKEGNVHTAIYSELFMNTKGIGMITNSSYARLYDDISSSLAVFDSNDSVVIDVFEPGESDDFDRDSIIIGFRRYINALYLGSKKEHNNRVVLFTASLIIGALLGYFLHNGLEAVISSWAYEILNIFSTVLIWEFAGYVAFQMNNEVKNLKRLRQICKADFEFRKWE